MADDFPVVRVYCVLVYDYLGKSTVEILINYVEDIALCVIEGIADFRGCQSFEMVIFALFVPIAVQFYFLSLSMANVIENPLPFARVQNSMK